MSARRGKPSSRSAERQKVASTTARIWSARRAARRAPYAAITAPALRSPCADTCGNCASSHYLRKRFPNPFEVKGLPNSVTRKVMLLDGVASRIV